MIDDAESKFAAKDLEVWLDDISIERLHPTVHQELQLLKTADNAEGGNPQLGMYKHGQLVAPGNAATARGVYEHNFDYTYALFAPSPTRVAFDVTIPKNARLTFSYALARSSKPGDPGATRLS